MGRKGKKSLKQDADSGRKQDELLKTLKDFTSKENWDQFFSLRGSDDSFEWYAEWPQIENLLTTHLLSPSSPPQIDEELPKMAAQDLSVLLPGCGNSSLSEHLYDAGFKNIMNIDFSKVVISNMLRKNLRERPEMKWRVMDMTDMQFVNGSFDVIVDKGGLDALMEPKHGSRLGSLYLSEVKRILKVGGKFICITLAESHVLGLLLPEFRFGWKMRLHDIALEPSLEKGKLQTFVVIVEKDHTCAVFDVLSFTDQTSVVSRGNQVYGICEALVKERKLRSVYSNGSDILYSLEDLKLGAKGNLVELDPGRRVKLTLGEPGLSIFSYKAVLLDAEQDSQPFTYHFGVFLVPRTRSHEWLFSSAEGQWLVVTSSKAARLLMILLDSSQSVGSMEEIQMDLSPLVKGLEPRNNDGLQIPFMAAGDGIIERKIVHKAVSPMTGEIIVEDVICTKLDDELNRRSPDKDLIFRRLTFQRTENLIQSEAILSAKEPKGISGKGGDIKPVATSTSEKKTIERKNDVHTSGSLASSSLVNVDHNYLASSYHNGVIAGLMLISTHLEEVFSVGRTVKAVVIGLGAGLLPMFLRNCLPLLEIKAVELDPVVLDVANRYFGFRQDEYLKVCISDGIKFVREIENHEAVKVATSCSDEESDAAYKKSVNGSSTTVNVEGKLSCKIDILIVDVDSADSISGLTCPAADFVEDSFLLSAKNSLSEQGLFIINLVSRSSSVKVPIYSKLKKVFVNLYSLQLEEDVNEVIFALKSGATVEEDKLDDSFSILARLLELEKREWGQKIVDSSKLIKPLV